MQHAQQQIHVMAGEVRLRVPHATHASIRMHRQVPQGHPLCLGSRGAARHPQHLTPDRWNQISFAYDRNASNARRLLLYVLS